MYTGKLDKSVSRRFNFGLRRPNLPKPFSQFWYLKSLDKSVLSISRSTMHDRLIEFACVYASSYQNNGYFWSANQNVPIVKLCLTWKKSNHEIERIKKKNYAKWVKISHACKLDHLQTYYLCCQSAPTF